MFRQSLAACFAIPLFKCGGRNFSLDQKFRELPPLRLTLEGHSQSRVLQLIAIGGLLPHNSVRAGSALGPVREVGRSALSDGPLLRHQQTGVFRRHVEHLIDLVTAEVNPVDLVGKFPSEPYPHD